MKLYLAGPMTGIPQHNFPAFRQAAEWLRQQGHEVISPAELHEEAEFYDCAPGDYKKYLPEDLTALASCDAVVMLPDSSRSHGAMWEAFSSLLFGLRCYRIKTFIDGTGLIPVDLGDLWWQVSAKAASNARIKMPIIDVSDERLAQDARWGQQNHSDEWWLAILGEEFGEVSQAILHDRFGGKASGTTRKELVQLAAVAMAWIECIDRRSKVIEETAAP